MNSYCTYVRVVCECTLDLPINDLNISVEYLWIANTNNLLVSCFILTMTYMITNI